MKQVLSLKKFVRIAMLTALAAVLTMFPQIPTGTGGYVHFGDSIIYLAAVFMGPWAGAAVGAIGHSIADLMSGYAIFAFPTFVIKGCIGYTVGKIVSGKLQPKRMIMAALAALGIVTFGYFLAEWPMYGIAAAVVVFISSPVQWLMSIVASAFFIPIVQKISHQIGLK
ncbi:ECF transporter S component [Ructibacterium gallinarum]|uniref:ECF transporter S component n=1 Tax=Ructibacterium gallinarum TaxID=2779355 RepID=A0A9D5M0P7_9FIRM|nr:ECF transporter S component [Ructibacterium gallinarum]MBE5040125.1 ECF transporter S component [Ructibacterium gallinarum]